MQVYKVRVWDNDNNRFYELLVDLETIIAQPYMIHMNDIGTIAINELRKQRGLEPLPNGLAVEDII